MVARLGVIGAAVTAALSVVVAGPASAAGTGTYRQVNLVSDQPGVAALTDPSLVNAWGLSHGPNTPIWASDNGADVTTLYRTDVAGSPATKVLQVAIPGGAPTGQVFNSTSSFVVPGTVNPARFVFAGENGDLSAWNGGGSAVRVHHSDTAVYKGLALVQGSSGPLLLAADFHDNRIDVFDGTFTLVSTVGMFHDRFLPAGYAPFDVAEIDGQVFVTYAKQDAARHDDVAGKAHGFVDVYTTDGGFVRRFATHGVLDSPWGITLAPATFGQFGGDVLIGNFGDGRIHAFDPRTGAVVGVLRGPSGGPLVIDGLWGLTVGDQVAGGVDSVWFSAGPDGEQHGLLGLLQPHRG
ncbi:MAG: TIGR03118 family protein [Cellulomonas sp.]|uniref:TIGR03118 family protein n=1 Tax=Cellulomonas sp. 73-92 TaxID=1895740 RepID=UPI0009264CFD|nr:TIGR03118 family protein [Cellulomonas sp. 73-92]MBN9375623.1 TIGR03118 family protein [Cellulomonas sp.]OJV81128.1 MAG: TIGR03118 family protein [Cellulomonas sp. 73-92]